MLFLFLNLFLWAIITLTDSIDPAAYTDANHPCPNSCSGHGRCQAKGRVCECFEGYTGGDCSLRICPYDKAWSDQATGVDEAHNTAECSNMGLCDRHTGLCICREGFEGIACERQSCPSDCHSVGQCVSMYYYARTRDPGEGSIYSYENVWDAQKVYGCDCDPKYHGIDCSLRYCPRGDDPLTGTLQISTKNPLQYNEIQRVSCKADEGTFTLTYKGKTTIPIPYNAKIYDLKKYIEALPTIGTGNIKIIMTGPQACTSYGTSFTVEFLQNFGSLPLLVPDKRKLLFSSTITNSILTVAKVVDGSKENLECSGRGICDTGSGVCSCATDFDTSNGYNQPGTRGDCGYAENLVQFCPGLIACSAHGECQANPTFKCKCADGWTGADCSERLCPEDLAWFTRPESNDVAHLTSNAECSNAGICDRTTGECQCQIGFTGAACNRLTCPTGTVASADADSTSAVCSNHGKCIDMATLASLATVNGDLAGFTYGTTPNNPYTWDAHRIYGCLCDDSYTGFDCSLMTCPYGDDPLTTGQDDEQQILSCTDSNADGTIVLTFRQGQTATISATVSTSELKTILQAVPSFGKVHVELYSPTGTITQNDTLCTTAGNQFLVTFLTVHSALPLIQREIKYIDTFLVTRYLPGTKESIECSGRGLCNHMTGQCECFRGFGSSDSRGNAGSYRDCGYQLPIDPTGASSNE